MMKFFMHNLVEVRIVSDTQSFSCTPERFVELEPDYPGLGNMLLRYWTQERSYESDGLNQFPCTVNCGVYVDNISNYTNLPAVYAHVTLNKNHLCVNSEVQDTIIFDCHLKADVDPESLDLPITQDWQIRLSHENGFRFDSFLATFIDGECQKSYVYKDGLPLGKWYVDDSLFDLVNVGGIEYQVKLASPVIYSLYREFI